MVNEHRRRYTWSTMAPQLPQREVLQLICRLVRKVRERFQKTMRATVDLFHPWSVVNRLLNWGFSPEQHWLKHGNFSFGSSVLDILRKREA